MRVVGNVHHGPSSRYEVAVKAVRNAVVGSVAGGITVLDDDPPPKVDIVSVADRVAEGQPLTRRVTLSAPVEFNPGFAWFEVLTTTGEPELSTTDVPAPWLESRFAASPLPERPLSGVVDHAALDIEIPSGQTSVEVQVPMVADGVSEPAETLRLRLASYWAPQKDRC